MTRRQLTRSVATYLNHQGEQVTEKTVDAVLVATLEVIEDLARQRSHLDLRGFGRFEGLRVPARQYVHPRSPGNRVMLPEHTTLRFYPSQQLRKRLNTA